MKLVNHTPIPDVKPICITALKLREVVVRRVGILRNPLDLRHNPLLPVRRELADGITEGFRGDDRIHWSVVLIGDISGPAGKCYPKKQL